MGVWRALALVVLLDDLALQRGARRGDARAGAQWVDLVPLMRTQAASGMVAGDELHPSADAYDAWAAELARVLPTPCAPGAEPRAP